MQLIMSNVNTIEKNSKYFENVYVNKYCYKYWKDTKCLALDEQELSLILLCTEILEKRAFDPSNYTSKKLFILRKNIDWKSDECTYPILSAEDVKYKRNKYNLNFSMVSEGAEVLIAYYASILYWANADNTEDFNGMNFFRDYFKIYAYFAFICPKIFCTLLLNQMYIFMVRINEQCPLKVINEFLEQTNVLWKQYNYLISNSGNIDVSRKVINEFRDIMGYSEEAYESLNDIEEWTDYGFLAFDYKEREAIQGGRIRKAVQGIEYFQRYLFLLKNIKFKSIKSENKIWENIENLYEQTKTLRGELVTILKDMKKEVASVDDDSATIDEFMGNFLKFCKNEQIQLIDV